jgi:hypothetical protein
MTANALNSIDAQSIIRASLSLPRVDDESVACSVEVACGNRDRYRITFWPRIQHASNGTIHGYWSAEWAERLDHG